MSLPSRASRALSASVCPFVVVSNTSICIGVRLDLRGDRVQDVRHPDGDDLALGQGEPPDDDALGDGLLDVRVRRDLPVVAEQLNLDSYLHFSCSPRAS